MRKVSERAPPEFVAVAIALAQQNRRWGIAIRDAFNVHGQLESLRFKRVKQKIEKLHGKPNQYPGRFTIQNQRVSPTFSTRGQNWLFHKQKRESNQRGKPENL